MVAIRADGDAEGPERGEAGQVQDAEDPLTSPTDFSVPRASNICSPSSFIVTFIYSYCFLFSDENLTSGS